MKKTLLSLVLLLTFFQIAVSQEKMEIEGAIILQNSEDPTPEPGTIRWSGSDFEGWNGLFWASLTGLNAGTVTDIDGNEYLTVTIGTQEWMAENLRTAKYRNGDGVLNFTNATHTDWVNLGIGAYCWFNDDDSHEELHGKLYNWFAVDDARELCPTGWHVPSDTEYTTLTDYLGGNGVAGGKLKEAGTLYWDSPNIGGTNESGFTGRGSGYRSKFGFAFFGDVASLWTSEERDTDPDEAHSFEFGNISDGTFPDISEKGQGNSVRCVKD